MFTFGSANFHPLMRCLKYNSALRCVNTTSVNNGITGFKISEKLHSRQLVQDFIFRLSHKERTILLDELQRFQAQAAAIRGVDWRHLKTAKSKTAKSVAAVALIHASKIDPPTSSQLRGLAAHSAMPFIGFGFLDNLIMILAGDYIDTTIGVTLGISTMAAAGMGNTLSDIAGIGSAFYVEQVATRIGVRAPSLTPAQIAMSRSRWCVNLGRALGVTIGCILGMFPLIFRHNKETEPKEKK